MKKNNFYAVILSGGSGERFWPLSTPENPKQFLTLFGGKSLLRQALDRLNGVIPMDNIIVITSKALIKRTAKELPDLPRENIIGEPMMRDTAPAVATACGIVESRGGENAVAAILTADHIMKDVKAFRQVLKDAVKVAATTDNIVTMGVAPTFPATGFGYIQLDKEFKTSTRTNFSHVVHFVEKPNLNLAKKYLASKKYVWNAGMFVWRVATMKNALVANVPELAILQAAVSDAGKNAQKVLNKLYPQLTRISIDYAVMEKIKNILVSCTAFGWDDVGTWSSTENHLDVGDNNNVVKGDVTLLDSDNCVTIAQGAQIAAIGVKDLVIVTTPSSVLVASKDRVQDLKKLLAQMKK